MDTDEGRTEGDALERAARVSGRLILVGLVVAGIVYALLKLQLVVLPVIVAIFAAAVLAPLVRFLRERGLANGIAAMTVMLGCGAILTGAGWLIGPALVDQFTSADVSVGEVVAETKRWIVNTFGISEARVENAFDRAERELRGNADRLASGLLGGARLLLELAAGVFLALFLLFFFLKDGEKMWAWIVRWVPIRRREFVDEAGGAAWETLGGYLRGVALVSLVDAVLIGIAMLALGVPLVVPLALLTFIGGFLPLIGATSAGALAVLVALASEGVVDAVILLAVILIVQQVEGDVLYPIIVGREIELHPVPTLLALTAGAVLLGIPGAFIAVPLVAIGHRIARLARDRHTEKIFTPSTEAIELEPHPVPDST